LLKILIFCKREFYNVLNMIAKTKFKILKEKFIFIAFLLKKLIFCKREFYNVLNMIAKTKFKILKDTHELT